MNSEHITNKMFETIAIWSSEHGFRIIFILILGIFAQYVSKFLIVKAVSRLVKSGRFSHAAEVKRENTLVSVLGGATNIMIWVVTLLILLSEIGIEVGPVLAAAGVVGIAIGFGGQYLIRDIISGVFIIIENQYRTGDVVCFDATCGLVEEITLRMTTLRDLDGTVHHIPHGEVKKVSNLTKYYSRVNINIGVAYHTNLEHVITVINKVGNDLAEDEQWKESIITAPQFLRVDDFADSAIILKILGDTQPMRQWDVAGELRKRVKLAFDAEGIEIPFPQRVVTVTRTEE
jgi:small-conductance mechanosensitive channel